MGVIPNEAHSLRERSGKETVKESPAKPQPCKDDCMHGQGFVLWEITPKALYVEKIYFTNIAYQITKCTSKKNQLKTK